MRSAPELLFSSYPIFDVVEQQQDKVKKKIADIPSNKLLNASEGDVISALVEEYSFRVPVLVEDEIHIADVAEAQIDARYLPGRMVLDRSRPVYVPGNRTVIAVPFVGDSAFFRIQPQSYTLSPPRAGVGERELLLTYERTDHDAEAIKRDYKNTVSEINKNLSWLRASEVEFGEKLTRIVTAGVQARKQRLLADAGMTAALGLPMKKREGFPSTFSVPVQRRVPRIEQLNTTESPFKPEPALASQDYEEIISILKNMVHVMEQSPRAFENMGEEELRTHFLVQLNGQFAGQATGETFNFQGKTDILIRIDGKPVFIAECKFWKGEQSFLGTIDQLLSYLSWRDTKAAVLVFNRNSGFSAVLAKIKDAVPKHPNFKRAMGEQDESTFRYVFGQPNDTNRELILTVMAFDVPTQA